MPIRRWNAPSPRIDAGMTRLLRILVAALACQVWGCASASVNNIGPTDSGAGDTVPQADGKNATDSTVKNDSATSDTFSGVCDPFTNSGCASDKKCTALQNNDNSLSLGCGDKEGTKAEGESCNQTAPSGMQTGDDCDDGLACFAVNAESTCHRICPTSGSAHACPSSSICSLYISHLYEQGLAFCQPPCKPLDQTGCQSGEACYSINIGDVCYSAGSKKPGDTCSISNPNDCMSGSTCITSGSTGVCSSYCSMAAGGTPSCSGGLTCNKLPGTLSEPNAGYCK